MIWESFWRLNNSLSPRLGETCGYRTRPWCPVLRRLKILGVRLHLPIGDTIIAFKLRRSVWLGRLRAAPVVALRRKRRGRDQVPGPISNKGTAQKRSTALPASSRRLHDCPSSLESFREEQTD